MDPEVRKELADGLRRASELLADGPFDSARRREILRAVEAVRSALLGMGFDEGGSRKRVVSFLRSVALANGVIGKRTSARLSHRTFEEDADAALKWLLEKGYLEDAGSEGFILTEQGYGYLEQHKSELLTQPERKGGGRARASMAAGARPGARSEGKAEQKPEVEAESGTVSEAASGMAVSEPMAAGVSPEAKISGAPEPDLVSDVEPGAAEVGVL